ncbi:ubiquinone/menaquinone biosynthesis C-methylase UbiE [Virgibacillus halotolerans]|uniref:class I SAM-dependent methyltransferase n=1 Tax=Virgibacillus halotolerans TaxID=1071053 RepID=UPI00195F6998|nr:class I SAM-dependent methyltransferase [Virgibacillus halotolerans]MBM7599848.1 ubiquinone/menaquinone biosynthesis C-methylase UbiE [Virgibacillus halotolerans]
MATFNWQKEAETQWDNRAAFWNERSKDMWDKGSRKDIVPFIEKHLAKGSNILDIGCGDGYGSFKLQQSEYDVTGMDISSEMIGMAEKRLATEPITFLQGDVNDLPFKDESFDGMMAINVLEWTESPAEGLEELIRVVKKDGLICIGLLGPTAGPRANSYPRLHGEKAICNTMMPWELQQLASEKGLAYVDGIGVYKDAVKETNQQNLPLNLKQALSFMWVFMLQKVGDKDEQ